MIGTLFTAAARKAWIGGALTALLTPLLNLLTGMDVISWRALAVAVVSGLLGAVGVFYTTNKDDEVDDTPGDHAVDRVVVDGERTSD